MPDNEVFGMIEQKKVEEQGFSLLKHDTIKCANCRKDLIEIIKIKENKDKTTASRVKCPYCSDSSFWFKTTGELRVQPAENLAILNVETNVRNGIIYNNFIVDVI